MVDDKDCLVVILTCLGFTIGNPKYLGGCGGLGGFELPPLRSNG
jgi:hypothetical protein